MRWLRSLLGVSRGAVFVVTVLGMLAVNVASFAVPMLASGMSGIAQAVLGRSVVAEIGQQVTAAKARNKSLRTDKAFLQTRKLVLRGDLETNRKKLGKTRADMDKATRGIARRAIRGAGRNVAAVPFEAVPVIGVATVVAVTALDVRDACGTIRDMQELRVASGVDDDPQGWTEEVCGMFPQPAAPAVCEMTIDECREHADTVRAQIGAETGDLIDAQCDALMEPDPEICRPPPPEKPEPAPLER